MAIISLETLKYEHTKKNPFSPELQSSPGEFVLSQALLGVTNLSGKGIL